MPRNGTLPHWASAGYTPATGQCRADPSPRLQRARTDHLVIGESHYVPCRGAKSGYVWLRTIVRSQ
jgi:hypothetical protein